MCGDYNLRREKRYVEVDVRFTPDGKIRPLAINYDKTRTYGIDRVLAVKHGKQANIRRETYTSQLMKGGHFTMNLPLFISSANFLLMKSLLLVLFRGLCSLLRLTAQQKIN